MSLARMQNSGMLDKQIYMFVIFLSDISVYIRCIFFYPAICVRQGWPIQAVQKYFYSIKIFFCNTKMHCYSSKMFVK